MKGHCCLTPISFTGSSAPSSFHSTLRVNPEGHVHAPTCVQASMCVEGLAFEGVNVISLLLRSERLFFLKSYLAQFLQDKGLNLEAVS